MLAVYNDMELVLHDDRVDIMAELQSQRDKLAWKIKLLDQSVDISEPLPKGFEKVAEDINEVIQKVMDVNKCMTEAVSEKLLNIRRELKHADIEGKYLKASLLS